MTLKLLIQIGQNHIIWLFYRLSKISGRYERDPAVDEINKSKKDTNAFVGDNCVGTALEFCLKLKGEEYKGKKGKILEYNLQLHAHNGSGFDTWIILNNLPCDKGSVNIIKNGKGNIELKILNGYIDKNKKQIPRYLHFRCGMTHLNYSLKNKEEFQITKRNIKYWNESWWNWWK